MTLRCREYLGEGKLKPSDYSYKRFWAKIDRTKGDKYVSSQEVDWGASRGQGKRSGRMVMGAMSDAAKGKKKYYDILGNAKLNRRDREEADSLSDLQKHMFAKALEAGFETDVAFLVAYSVGDNRISRKEVYKLVTEE